MNDTPRMTRRGALSAGIMAVAALAVESSAAAANRLDTNTAAGRLKAYLMMRAALNDQLVIGFLSGRYYGVIDAEITPLYGVVSATFARYRPRADGTYEGESYEVPFFTDLDTGEPLDRWRNPYTDEQVDVPQMKFPATSLVIKPDLEVVVPGAVPGLSMQNRVVSTLVSDQDVWMTEVTTSAMTVRPDQHPLRYNEIVILHSTLAELNRPHIHRAPCQTTYTSVVSWRPWLKMGDRPGHLLGNGAGGYGARLDRLPGNWRAAAGARRPEVLKDPEALLRQARHKHDANMP